MSHFVEQAKKVEFVEKDIEKFFKEKKENYRVGEKKKASYWTLTPDDYKDKIDIDEARVGKYYEKNKASLYRIPPQVKVRRLVIKVSN